MKKISFGKREPTKSGAVLNALGGAVMAYVGAAYGIPELGLAIGLIWTILFGAYAVYQIFVLIGLMKMDK